MIERYKHIFATAVLLVGFCLTFSVFHFHDLPAITETPKSDSAVTHTVDISSSECPLCSYLLKSDSIPDTGSEIGIKETEKVFAEDFTLHENTPDGSPSNKSPPYFG